MVVKLEALKVGWERENRMKQTHRGTKPVGLIGGLGWPATLVFQRAFHSEVLQLTNGLHTGNLIIYSIDCPEIANAVSSGRKLSVDDQLISIHDFFVESGVSAFALACNSLQAKVMELGLSVRNGVRFFSIFDAVLAEVRRLEVSFPLVFSTKHTIQTKLYNDGLTSAGIGLLELSDSHASALNQLIFDSLIYEVSTQNSVLRLINSFISSDEYDSCDSIILACTDLSPIDGPIDYRIPVLDSTVLNARSLAKEWVTSNSIDLF